MKKRQTLQVGMLAWAVAGAAVALSALRTVNTDARVFVGVASVAGPLAAVGAARMIARERERLAGALLIVSVLTPTYFAYVLNLLALLVGLFLVVAPRRAVKSVVV